MIVGLYALAFQTIFNFIICYFADTVTYASLNIANILYDMNWYEFSIEERKLILIMIQRAQITFHFKGNNSIACSLHTFLKVTFIGEIFLDSTINIKIIFLDCKIGIFLLCFLQNGQIYSKQINKFVILMILWINKRF